MRQQVLFIKSHYRLSTLLIQHLCHHSLSAKNEWCMKCWILRLFAPVCPGNFLDEKRTGDFTFPTYRGKKHRFPTLNATLKWGVDPRNWGFSENGVFWRLKMHFWASSSFPIPSVPPTPLDRSRIGRDRIDLIYIIFNYLYI